MKITTRQITVTAVLLAICVISQFFKNASVYITGPIINACIILACLCVGLTCGIVLSVITPITAFFITGSPIVAAIPAIMPCIMIGNTILALFVYFLKNKPNAKLGLPLSMVVGSIVKALFMGVVISYTLIPMLIPEKMVPKMAIFQTTFSITQLTTAIIGSIYAYVIWLPLKKYISSSKQ